MLICRHAAPLGLPLRLVGSGLLVAWLFRFEFGFEVLDGLTSQVHANDGPSSFIVSL